MVTQKQPSTNPSCFVGLDPLDSASLLPSSVGRFHDPEPVGGDLIMTISSVTFVWVVLSRDTSARTRQRGLLSFVVVTVPNVTSFDRSGTAPAGRIGCLSSPSFVVAPDAVGSSITDKNLFKASKATCRSCRAIKSKTVRPFCSTSFSDRPNKAKKRTLPSNNTPPKDAMAYELETYKQSHTGTHTHTQRERECVCVCVYVVYSTKCQ